MLACESFINAVSLRDVEQCLLPACDIVGVIFKLSVVSGRDVGQYSYFPSEGEILLSPNTRFVVTRELYTERDGYSYVDLAETKGGLFSS